MGKLMHNTQIHHSSHPHLLQLLSNLHLQNQAPITCNGCNLHISPSDHIYTCRPCNFFLHTSCSKFPELITHPSHREHALSLLPTSIYPGGFFRCDACALQGTRFSYHCQICDFDLHVLCASKPLSVNHPFHPHPLVLTFSSPYGEKVGFSCDVCQNVGLCDQWLYRCVSCEFDVHLHCATAKTPIPPISHSNNYLQHNHSFPGSSLGPGPAPQYGAGPGPGPGQLLSHSMSTGHVQSYGQPYQQPQSQPPVGVQSYQGQSQPAMGNQNVAPQLLSHSMSTGHVQSYGQPYQQPQSQPPVGVQSYQGQSQPAMGNQNVAPDNGMGNVIVTGFVDGMMQQLGQNFVQTLTGGGDGGGNNGGGGGGDVVNIEYQCTTVNESCENYDED